MKPYVLTPVAFLGLTVSGPVARSQVEFNFTYTGKPDNFTVPSPALTGSSPSVRRAGTGLLRFLLGRVV